MIADGTKLMVLKIVMGAPSGHWAPFWASPAIMDCGVLPVGCSSCPCPQLWSLTVLAPVPTLCLEFRNISIRIPETATHRRFDPRSAGRLLDMYESIRHPDWKWFENVLAYGNARLPQACCSSALLAPKPTSGENSTGTGGMNKITRNIRITKLRVGPGVEYRVARASTGRQADSSRHGPD